MDTVETTTRPLVRVVLEEKVLVGMVMEEMVVVLLMVPGICYTIISSEIN